MLVIQAALERRDGDRSATPAVFVGARTDPNEQESVVMRPDLEHRVS